MNNIIFDVDGTLVDSVDLHARAWAEAFAHFDHPVDVGVIRARIGKGGDHILPEFLSEDERARFGKDLEDWRDRRFMTAFLPRVRPFPMVRELFARLRDDGRKLALASSGKKELVSYLKQLLRIDEFLEAEVSSTDAARSKPDPDILEAALARLGHPAVSETLMVGDSPYDAEAASKIGVETVGLLCGGFPSDALRTAGCVALYRDPAHLLWEYDRSPLARVRSSENARS